MTLSPLSPVPVRERTGFFIALLCAAVIGVAAFTVTAARANSHDTGDSAAIPAPASVGGLTDADLLQDNINLKDAYLKESADFLFKVRQDGGEPSDEDAAKAHQLYAVGQLLYGTGSVSQASEDSGAAQ